MERDAPDAGPPARDSAPDAVASDAVTGASMANGSGANASVTALFSRVIDDGERFVLAEMRVYRARLWNRVAPLRWALLMALAGLFLAQSTVVALLVGLVLGLSQQLGTFGATAAVTVAALLLAALLIGLAVARFRRAIMPPLDPSADTP